VAALDQPRACDDGRTTPDTAGRKGWITLRTLACVAALLGGLAWVGRAVVADAPVALLWAGVVLVALALSAAGASLVSRGASWLRAIVAVAFPALVLSVYSAVREAADPVTVDAVAGVVTALVAVGFWLLAPRPARSRGAHAR
jgi:hypothetical protein